MYNICFCADNNYAKYMAVTIVSILKNSLDEEEFTFHIIESNFTNDTRDKIVELKKIKDFNIKFYDAKDNKYNNFNRMKLLIPELIKDVDKILYLDSDIIVINSLSELFNIDMENYYVLAIEDLYVYTKEHNLYIGIKEDSIYFNSGVIMFNNKLCIENDIYKEFEDYYYKNKDTMIYKDQDILNYVFEDRVKIIDRKWNFYPFRDYNNKSVPPTKEEAIIIHFVEHKPWKGEGSDKTYFIDDYWRYYQYTPWFFEEPISAIQTMIQQKLYDYDSIRLRSNYLKLFGIYTNHKCLQIVIFGIRITIDAIDYRNISKIAWWIPVKKWREGFKNIFR